MPSLRQTRLQAIPKLPPTCRGTVTPRVLNVSCSRSIEIIPGSLTGSSSLAVIPLLRMPVLSQEPDPDTPGHSPDQDI